ncbi:MAG: metallophosphoesterase family protein [Pseudomonadales bacterium]|nr:metallophosphoesterase family protein [Pseudomonadales bacterium]
MNLLYKNTKRLPLKLMTIILVYAVSNSAIAHFSPEQLANIEIASYQPSPVPDRIVMTLAGDPATERAVNWRTNNDVEPALAQIAISDGSPTQEERAVTVIGNTESLSFSEYRSFHHSVHFTGLDPDTLYVYRVGDGQVWSEWMQFRTAKDTVSPFKFIYLGDAQNDLKSRWSRVIRQAYSDMPKADFILHAGDLVNDANNDQEWGQWFYATGWIYGSIPSIATPGNHEYDDRKLAKQWQPHFTFPKNGPNTPRLSETVYYLDYQGVRFISLDTGSMDSDPLVSTLQQSKWLQEVLEHNPNQWTIIFHHHPMRAATKSRSGHILLNLFFRQIYERYNVDLVLQGHDHAYARGESVSYFGNWAGRQSPMYVVSVSGPKMYEGGASWPAVGGKNTQLYQLIELDGNQLKYQSYRADGVLFDEFKITKNEDGLRTIEP